MPRRPPASSTAIDLAKVLAAHLILFHHFVIYGPVPSGLGAGVAALVERLASDGRLAVQVFLVIGGYLGAGSMLARLERADDAHAPAWRASALLVARAKRLLPAYWLTAALMLAVAAWLHWGLTTPGAPVPAPAQIAANLLLLQDVLGFEGLSAGFWYVAIDLQLYAGLVLMAALCRALAKSPSQRVALFGVSTVGLVLASLLGWNLRPELDAWAPYFAGSYGLGMLAWVLRRRAGCSTAVSALFIGVVGLLALTLAWRARIAVATLTAVALCALPHADALLRHAPQRALRSLQVLAGASYPMFLLHYPLLVGVCGTVSALTDDGMLRLAALGACWPASVALGCWVQRRLSDPPRVRSSPAHPALA